MRGAGERGRKRDKIQNVMGDVMRKEKEIDRIVQMKCSKECKKIRIRIAIENIVKIVVLVDPYVNG